MSSRLKGIEAVGKGAEAGILGGMGLLGVKLTGGTGCGTEGKGGGAAAGGCAWGGAGFDGMPKRPKGSSSMPLFLKFRGEPAIGTPAAFIAWSAFTCLQLAQMGWPASTSRQLAQ